MKRGMKMNETDILYSFIIGIASGIVSSVIVTICYRIKDGEKERQNYFTNLRLYFAGLTNIDVTEVDSLFGYMSTHELPKTFKWIHFKKSEWVIITNLYEKVMLLNESVCTYVEEKYKLVDQNKSEDEIDCILGTTYLRQIIHAKTLILKESITIQSLGNKTLKKILKNS